MIDTMRLFMLNLALTNKGDLNDILIMKGWVMTCEKERKERGE